MSLMSSKKGRFRIAILDNFQQVALSLADKWYRVRGRPSQYLRPSRFNDHLVDSYAA
jgi:hypothetical protein